jgi:hypothetical protein
MDVYDLISWVERQMARNARNGERFSCPMTILDGRLDGLQLMFSARKGWSKHTTATVSGLG